MSKAAAHVMFPETLDSLEPIEIQDGISTVKAAFVGRYAINQIPEQWRKIGLCGIYVLLSDVRGDEGSFDAYVGYTKTGFERRLFDHDGTKSYWQQAILFARLDGPSLSSTHAQWLEGEIVRLLKQGAHVRVHNIRYTGDETLPEYELPTVEQISLFIMRVLFLRGYRSASLGSEVKRLEMAVRDGGGRDDRTAARTPVQNHVGYGQQAVAGQVPARITPVGEIPQPVITQMVTKVADLTHPRQVPHIIASSDPVADMVYGNLWETLRKWRWRVKEEAELFKAYHVFTDAELSNIMTNRPNGVDELRALPGCTVKKVDRFGESLMATLQAYYVSERVEPEPVIVVEKPRRWWQ